MYCIEEVWSFFKMKEAQKNYTNKKQIRHKGKCKKEMSESITVN